PALGILAHVGADPALGHPVSGVRHQDPQRGNRSMKKRMVPLIVEAHLSQSSLERALIQFITEKVDGKVVASPPQYTLHVSSAAYNRALTLMAFDLNRSIVPPGIAINLE